MSLEDWLRPPSDPALGRDSDLRACATEQPEEWLRPPSRAAHGVPTGVRANSPQQSRTQSASSGGAIETQDGGISGAYRALRRPHLPDSSCSSQVFRRSSHDQVIQQPQQRSRRYAAAASPPPGPSLRYPSLPGQLLRDTSRPSSSSAWPPQRPVTGRVWRPVPASSDPSPGSEWDVAPEPHERSPSAFSQAPAALPRPDILGVTRTSQGYKWDDWNSRRRDSLEPYVAPEPDEGSPSVPSQALAALPRPDILGVTRTSQGSEWDAWNSGRRGSLKPYVAPEPHERSPSVPSQSLAALLAALPSRDTCADTCPASISSGSRRAMSLAQIVRTTCQTANSSGSRQTLSLDEIVYTTCPTSNSSGIRETLSLASYFSSYEQGEGSDRQVRDVLLARRASEDRLVQRAIPSAPRSDSPRSVPSLTPRASTLGLTTHWWESLQPRDFSTEQFTVHPGRVSSDAATGAMTIEEAKAICADLSDYDGFAFHCGHGGGLDARMFFVEDWRDGNSRGEDDGMDGIWPYASCNQLQECQWVCFRKEQLSDSSLKVAFDVGAESCARLGITWELPNFKPGDVARLLSSGQAWLLKALHITSVGKGLVNDWNEANHPSWHIRPGDLITEVNGVSSVHKMAIEFKSERILYIMFFLVQADAGSDADTHVEVLEDEIGRSQIRGRWRRTRKDLADMPDEEDLCAICLEELSGGEELRVLPCRHRFHLTCIGPWMMKSNTCPLCMDQPNETADEKVP